MNSLGFALLRDAGVGSAVAVVVMRQPSLCLYIHESQIALLASPEHRFEYAFG
jgi:uncharacterized membrane protein